MASSDDRTWLEAKRSCGGLQAGIPRYLNGIQKFQQPQKAGNAKIAVSGTTGSSESSMQIARPIRGGFSSAHGSH
eukprot:2448654-Prymnesium_polylepis.1